MLLTACGVGFYPLQKDEDSTNYADWLPPESKVLNLVVTSDLFLFIHHAEQTGDGKTFLNEKFGY